MRSVSPGTSGYQRQRQRAQLRAPVRGTQIDLRQQAVKQERGERLSLHHPRLKRRFALFTHQRIRVFAVRQKHKTQLAAIGHVRQRRLQRAPRHRGRPGRRRSSR